ncbi:MAG: ABC transporter substrate binding protein, partial [Planctomycetota bacterium]
MSSRLWREILIIWMLFAVSDLRARPEEDEPTIGVLFWHQSPNDFVAFEGIRSGFESAGREPTFFARQASSSEDAAHRILDEFRARRVDLVFAMGTQASLLAKERLEDIPIVFTAVTNPVESGVVPSWEGSKRNLAGNSNWIGPDKILPVFRMAVPRLSRLGVLRSEKAGLVSEAELRGVRDYLAAQEKPPVVIVEEVVAAT